MKLFVTLGLLTSLLLASIDVNTADKETLMSLKGIGAAKAASIIAYREAQCIKDLDELQKVRGIGPSIATKNKDKINFGTCKK